VQIGMDTPQIRSGDLDDAMERLATADNEAVIGPALDGGWWAIGLHRPDPEVFRGVPMSTAETGTHQLRRLRDLGLRTEVLGVQRDVDEPDDVAAVAAEHPEGRFAEVARALLSPVGAGVRR
jgi:glycosyltransferase A (GT-A) superfamily protein (DUF2064 family)